LAAVLVLPLVGVRSDRSYARFARKALLKLTIGTDEASAAFAGFPRWQVPLDARRRVASTDEDRGMFTQLGVIMIMEETTS
jgi:hypothetical protein